MYNDDYAQDESALLNALGTVPDGPVARILDHCYNSLKAASVPVIVENLSALSPQHINALEGFMNSAPYPSKYAFICQYFEMLSPDEMAVWIEGAVSHVDYVSVKMGCDTNDVIRCLNVFVAFKNYAPHLMSTPEQEYGLLSLLSLFQSKNHPRWRGVETGQRFLDDRDVLGLILSNPDDAKRIYELCELHGEDRGFVIKEVFEGRMPAALSPGML
jgi:hypothetical protein